MFVLLGELNFWTFDSDVDIKETDFGAFSYHDKKIDNVYEEGKRSYAQKRGMVYVPQNKKGNKLKDSIKFLEEQLNDYATIYCQWVDYSAMQIMLSSGLLIYIQVNLCTGDIKKIVFDKYLIGKLTDRLSDVVITKNYLVCTYNDTQVTLVNFVKPKKSIFDKISRLDPKLTTFEISGPTGKRIEKKIQHNRTEDLILIWWKCTMNEVYPWSPTVKEHDRANVHLYRIIGTKLELLCYLKTEFDPLCITFNASYENIIHSLEQKVSRKGEVTVEWRTYKISQNDKLHRVAILSIPLPTHTSCVKFSPNQEMLLLCCIDGSITLHDQIKGTNNSMKAAFIPTLACWHGDGHVFAVGNERGQVQYFDLALTCIKSQMLCEDIAPNNIIDLSSYFRAQPALITIEWSKKNEINTFVDYYNHGDSLFLIFFERGPIAIFKITEGENFSGDVLVQRYLMQSQVEQATSLLLAMNWDTNPHACMQSLNQIVNHLFKLPLTPEREAHIQNALGSFHVPVKPLTQLVIDEYGDEIRDLTRRFFHHLLRHRLFEKAFRLAIDLNDHDLFMDIHFYAIVLKDTEMATAAKEKAEEILVSQCNSCSSSSGSHSTCSRDSCSLCSDSASDDKDDSYTEDTESEELPKKERLRSKRSSKHTKYSRSSSNSQAPPLPILCPPVYNGGVGGFMSTPFNELADKTEPNLVSTSFNVPSVPSYNLDLPPTTGYYGSIPNFIPNSLVTSVAPPYIGNPVSFSPMTNPSYGQPIRSYDNLLLSSPFRNLSLASRLTPSVAQSSLNSMSLENVAHSYHQMSNFMSGALNPTTAFNEPIEIPPSSLTPLTVENNNTSSNNNVMSTSFGSSGNRFGMDAASRNDTYVGTDYDGADNKKATGLTVLKNLKLNSYPVQPNVQQSSAQQQQQSCGLNDVCLAGNDTVAPLSIFSSGSDLMSTSFNDPEDPNEDANSNSCESNSSSTGNVPKQKDSAANVTPPPPPPPLITESLANYIHSLPKKNFTLSRSTPGLTDLMDNQVLKLQRVKPLHTANSLLQQQNSVSNILKSHRGNNNFQSTCNYRLDYDLDYIPFGNSCDSLINSHSTTVNHAKSSSYGVSLKTSLDLKHPFKLGFSQSSTNINVSREHRLSSNVPPLPVISSSSTNEKSSSQSFTSTELSSLTMEKPKVKFSDTVTHILVPNSGQIRKEQLYKSGSIQKRPVAQMYPVDTKQESEDLSLKSNNDNYLKNFPSASKDDSNKTMKTEEAAKIKVVHFGPL